MDVELLLKSRKEINHHRVKKLNEANALWNGSFKQRRQAKKIIQDDYQLERALRRQPWPIEYRDERISLPTGGTAIITWEITSEEIKERADHASFMGSIYKLQQESHAEMRNIFESACAKNEFTPEEIDRFINLKNKYDGVWSLVRMMDYGHDLSQVKYWLRHNT